jgi:hypothetical protein
MALAAKVQAVGLTFTQAAEEAKAEARSAAWMVKTATEQHAEIMQTPPAPLKWRVFVDGVEGAALTSVRFGGQIRYQYARMDVVVDFAIMGLKRLSPVLTGRYLATHQMLIDGMLAHTFAEWDWGQEIVLTNLQPYARKIEVGAMKMRVPGTDHVFQNVAKYTRAQYNTVASVAFSYRPMAAGATVPAGTKPTNKVLRYPVIIIKGFD